MRGRGALKTHFAIVAALLVTLFVGRLWGACGRWELDRALQASDLRGDLLEAHASLLGARVSLCNADVGALGLHLENARASIGRANTRLGRTGLNDEQLRRQFMNVGAGIDDAQRLAARLTQGANYASGVHGPEWPPKTSENP